MARDSIFCFEIYPALYNLVYKKLVTVEKAVSGGLSASSFRRPLRESTEERQQMMVICETIQLIDGTDVVQWQLDGKVFTVSSTIPEAQDL